MSVTLDGSNTGRLHYLEAVMIAHLLIVLVHHSQYKPTMDGNNHCPTGPITAGSSFWKKTHQSSAETSDVGNEPGRHFPSAYLAMTKHIISIGTVRGADIRLSIIDHLDTKVGQGTSNKNLLYVCQRKIPNDRNA